MSRARQITIVAAAAAAALVFVALFAQRHGFFDLNVYYGAVRYWVSGGEIYDFVRPRSTYGFTYPPFAALAMLPMAVLAWPVAIVLSCAATALVTWWLLRRLLTPLARARGWDRWFVVALALCLVTVYEPMRETFLFGQVNMLLLGLVAVDLLVLAARGSRWTGVGIGLATAIKLTPGIFIVYLLITGRWRAALTAAGTAAGATLAAAAIAPDASREFWTSALWDTDRVGVLSFISNQSLQGMLARIGDLPGGKAVWALLVLGVLAVWSVRCRRAAAQGDEVAGLAYTGIVGVLISPVTWVHHLVWLIPALVLLVQHGTAAPGRRRWALLGLAAASYAILTSRVVWLWEDRVGGWAVFFGANAYVWICLALLLLTPITARPAPDLPGLPDFPDEGAAQLGDVDVAAARPKRRVRAVRV
ncbi:glycosyltransferase 87 family protein [Catellatospora sp. KI3]|uniref:glycosyltransferase 87 family protein n=1 Tax=Catellatospora sp. KI3 TaxID=3041620 RepID=UPI0024828197|nr:glycosyltransferase 87 family protein [Catellatospora sp. KI3]MDI1459408.1 glycosyltransferase 87 family protein [Catellatospora sp. KI3]